MMNNPQTPLILKPILLFLKHYSENAMQNKIVLALPLLIAISTSGCTLNEGDPQVTLCQKLAENLSKNPQLNWDQSTKKPLQDNSIKVDVRTSKDNSTTLKGSCIYLTNEDAAGEDFEINVEAEYQNLPDSMVVNGKQIATNDLYRAIQKVTGQSVKDTLKKLH